MKSNAMGVIEFVVDEAVLRDDLQETPRLADAAVLEMTYFVMPVRMCFGDVELLEWRSRAPVPGFVGNEAGDLVQVEFRDAGSAWMALPLIGLVAGFQEFLSRAEQERPFLVTAPVEPLLACIRREDHVHVKSEVNGRSASVPWREFVSAVGEFRNRVAELLSNRVPRVMEHPNWHSWFG
jgi:hypothetical protein